MPSGLSNANLSPNLRQPSEHIELTSYRPPVAIQQQQAQSQENVPSFRQEPVLHAPSHYVNNSLYNENPATDLADPTLSHGFACFQCVRTQELGYMENFGRFDKILGPGFHCLAWPMETISGRVSLRVKQLDVTCETKTKDHVFVHMTISLLYRIAAVNAYEAYYRLASPKSLIESSIVDVVRGTIPSRMTLDETYASQDTIAEVVFTRLQDILSNYGYEVLSTLVTNISPNARVKESMNEIYANRKHKEAMSHQAEARKIELVTHAQAQATRSAWNGVGVSRMRQAIAGGLRESIEQWTEVDVRVPAPPPRPKEVMDLLLLSQYMDVLTHVTAGKKNGEQPQSKLFVDISPTGPLGTPLVV